jgi:hypothetical protein
MKADKRNFTDIRSSLLGMSYNIVLKEMTPMRRGNVKSTLMGRK